MKKLLVLIVLLAAGYFAYQYFSGGNLSAEQKQVQALVDDFANAKQRLTQAERSAGLSGVDTTSSAEEAIRIVAQLKEKLQALQETLTEDKAIEMADKLQEDMQAFLSGKGY